MLWWGSQVQGIELTQHDIKNLDFGSIEAMHKQLVNWDLPDWITGDAPKSSEPDESDTFKVEQVSSQGWQPSGYGPVSGTISYDAATKTVTFTPSNNLAKGAYRTTIYHVFYLPYGVTAGVEDKADNALANNYTWSFRR